jgi:hypothetical protein
MRNTILARSTADHASQFPWLSSVQRQVLASIVAGNTISSAASSAGVHRNTVTTWLTLPFFRQALQQAHVDQELFWREQAERRAIRAFEIFDELANDPNTPASIRYKVARDIIEWASCPLSIPSVSPYRLEPYGHPEESSEMHNSAHPVQPTPCPAAEKPSEMHNSAHVESKRTPDPWPQSPVPGSQRLPKVGRNQLCPCGSGKKFKHCCLRKPLVAASSAAAA